MDISIISIRSWNHNIFHQVITTKKSEFLFPLGFGKGLGVHRLLVSYLRDQFQDLIAHPSLTWRASLRDIWARRQNVFLAYDHEAMVEEFPEVLFGSVEQRWGNKQTWAQLEGYLRNVNDFDVS